MTKLLSMLLLVLPAFAQVTMTLTGPTTVARGGTVTLSLSTSGATANGPVGVQWTATPPSSLTISAVALGTQTTAGSKTLACSTNKTLCFIYGTGTVQIAQGVIANGQAATLTVQVPATATLGVLTFPLTGLMAVDKNGAAMTSTSGPVHSITVLPLISDLNGDGAVTLADVTLMVAQANGTATCTNDQNGDGVCNIFDVVIVSLRAAGLPI